MECFCSSAAEFVQHTFYDAVPEGFKQVHIFVIEDNEDFISSLKVYLSELENCGQNILYINRQDEVVNGVSQFTATVCVGKPHSAA